MIFAKREDLVFPDEIEVNGDNYGIEVIFAKKKNSSVSVKGSKLVFRLSSYLSNKKKNEHFSDLLRKICLKIEKSPVTVVQREFKDVLECGEFEFANQRYLIEFTTRVRGVKLNENTFFVNPQTKIDNIEKHILRLLSERYYERLKEYVFALNKQTYNFNINGFELKLLNSKWGHCTSNDVLMLNLKLLNAPLDILNYVIFHELSHIKVKNHSNLFWKEVEKFCPNHKVLRKRLRLNPPEVFM